jgi:hypothetical protein
MEENARNQAWEDLNAPDPYEKQMRKAAVHMGLATGFMEISEDRMYDAIAELADTPMGDKLQSLVEEIMNLHSEIRKLEDCYAKGCRE